ncbi:hypothetical protein GIB67_021663, partial [Kingdonia uniflora]
MQVKAYTSRVGVGPFPKELLDDVGDLLRKSGHEFGTTTGHPQHCDWMDIVTLKYCCLINGFSSLNQTKLDVLSDFHKIKLGISYKKIDGKIIESFPSYLTVLEQLEYWFYEYCGVGHPIVKEEVKFLAYPRCRAWKRGNKRKTNDQAANLFILSRYHIDHQTIETITWRPWLDSAVSELDDVRTASLMS